MHALLLSLVLAGAAPRLPTLERTAVELGTLATRGHWYRARDLITAAKLAVSDLQGRVMQLEALVREIQLNGTAGTVDRAWRPLVQAQQLWLALKRKPPIIGSSEARTIQLQLDQLAAAVEAHDALHLTPSECQALTSLDRLAGGYRGA